MIYELIQFYSDEISSWEKTVLSFHNGIDEHLGRIGLILKMKINNNQENLLHNQVTVMLTYNSDFDDLKMRLFSQRQRLSRLITSTAADLDSDLRTHQEKLRTRIYTLQSTFCRAEYHCSKLAFNCLKSQSDN